jgi:hypothetical protein
MSVDEEAADIDLTELARWLVERYGPAAPNYRALWEACAGGRIAAYRVRRCWRVRLADRPAVAEYFGLPADSTAPPASTPRTPDKPHAA